MLDNTVRAQILLLVTQILKKTAMLDNIVRVPNTFVGSLNSKKLTMLDIIIDIAPNTKETNNAR